MKQRNWSKDELLLVLNLYCKLTFGQFNKSTSEIVSLSGILERTPSAISLKLCNFASLDDTLRKRGIKGMSNVSKLDREMWAAFQNNWFDLAFEGERLLAERRGNEFPTIDEVPTTVEIGVTEKSRTMKTRVNQNLFRQAVLTNYSNTCAICDLNHVALLRASHIVPWSQDVENRLTPRNGICFCVLHDGAFDRGLITVDKSFCMQVASELALLSNRKFYESYFGHYRNQQLRLPQKFIPNEEFLKYHREKVFRN